MNNNCLNCAFYKKPEIQIYNNIPRKCLKNNNEIMNNFWDKIKDMKSGTEYGDLECFESQVNALDKMIEITKEILNEIANK